MIRYIIKYVSVSFCSMFFYFPVVRCMVGPDVPAGVTVSLSNVKRTSTGSQADFTVEVRGGGGSNSQNYIFMVSKIFGNSASEIWWLIFLLFYTLFPPVRVFVKPTEFFWSVS